MTPRLRYNFWVDEEQREGLRFIKERDGIPEAEQIRRGIDLWLESKGVVKAPRKRAVSRKRLKARSPQP